MLLYSLVLIYSVGVSLQIVKHAKLLGVIISENLKWDKNTEYLVKKAYSRSELLKKGAELTE